MRLPAEKYEHAVFRTRVAATTALMSELLPLGNNDRVTFEVTVASHGLDLPADPVASDTTLRAWWGTPASLPVVYPDGWDDEDPMASQLRLTAQAPPRRSSPTASAMWNAAHSSLSELNTSPE